MDIKSYRLPVADAGQDTQFALPLDSFLLDGSGSKKTDLEIASYEWGLILGSSSIQIRSPQTAKTMVIGLKEGMNQFELKVKDVLGQVGRDTILINVSEIPKPVADAGEDQIIVRPFRSVLLTGKNSIAVGKDITSYFWKYIGGPSCYKIHHPDSMVTEVSELVVGIYFFELKVTDAGGLNSMDTVMVTVKENEASRDPVASISCDPYVVSKEEAEVEIFATSFAYDDVGTFFYSNSGHDWTQLSGPNIAVIGKPEDRISHSVTKMSNLIKGTYVFQLKANFSGSVAYDTVIVNVVEDDRKGKEFVFESTWKYDNDWGFFPYALTPVRPELFYSSSERKMSVYIQLDNTSDWIDLSLSSSKYYVVANYCEHSLSINLSSDNSSLIGTKLKIKVRYD